MAGLGHRERNVLVLRFLQQRSFKEVGDALGISEDAAKKRTGRALEKLRRKLVQRSVVLTEATLGLLLAERTLQAAPVTVAKGAVAAGCQAGALAPTAAVALASRAAREWAWTRLKWGLGTAGVISIVVLMAVRFGSAGIPRSAARPPPAGSGVSASEASQAAVLADEVQPPSRPRARSMRLRLLAAESGAPIPDSAIHAVFFGPKFIDADLAGDGEGTVEIALPQRAFEGMALRISAKARVPVCLGWGEQEEPSLPAEYLVKLEPGIQVSGRVVDEEGNPVAGVVLPGWVSASWTWLRAV